MTDAPTGFELGLFTFGELTRDPASGELLPAAKRLQEFVDLAVVADRAGLDVFGVGEHHRRDFAIASPPVVLAAIAQATEPIRLTSTVTVLSTADPVKVFEDFATVDLLSGRSDWAGCPSRRPPRRSNCWPPRCCGRTPRTGRGRRLTVSHAADRPRWRRPGRRADAVARQRGRDRPAPGLPWRSALTSSGGHAGAPAPAGGR